MALYHGTTKISGVNIGGNSVPTGNIDIISNYSHIDIAQYATASVNVPPVLTFGTLRPDAELIGSWSGNDNLVADRNITNFKRPSTSYTTGMTAALAQNISDAITAEAAYNYFVLGRTLTIPEYGTLGDGKGKEEYAACAYYQELVDIPASAFVSIGGSATYATASRGFVTSTIYRMPYWTSPTAISLYTSTYGIWQFPVAPTFSSNKITMRSPYVYIRGSSTYLTAAYYEDMVDANLQYKIELYRAPKDNLNIDGWGLEQQIRKIADDVKNNNGVLT